MTNNLWIPHTGGECPVDPDTVVEVMVACGIFHGIKEAAKVLVWDNPDPKRRIVLYRIVEQPKADWEKWFYDHSNERVAATAYTTEALYQAFAARLKAEGRG